MIPSETKCLHLLHAAGCARRVIIHSIAVYELSLLITDSINTKNPGLVSLPHIEAGALLHDIGRSAFHSIHHACAGAAICRSHQIDEKVCNIVNNHIGAGLLASEAQELGLHPIDYMPVSLEEKIIAHADNLIMGKRIISLKKRIKTAKENGLSPIAIERMIDLHHELNHLCMIPIEELNIKKPILKKRIQKHLRYHSMQEK